jgi:hypothetical protein
MNLPLIELDAFSTPNMDASTRIAQCVLFSLMAPGVSL